MQKKRSVWARLYWYFWNLLRKIGVWGSCPNCDSAWTGGHSNPHTIKSCVVCGQDKKEEVPNGWVWGWVVPMFIQRRIVARRCDENRPLSDFGEAPKTEKQLYHIWYSGQQHRAMDHLDRDLRGIARYRLVETSEATTERHSEAIANGEEPEVAVTEASLNPTPSGIWDDYVYLGRGY